jgi:hypothetical protein
VRTENKIALIFYGIGALGGAISGVLSLSANLGYVAGLLLYLVAPKIVMVVVKDLPEELRDERALLRKGFWSFMLFWLYFTILFYNALNPQSPIFYSNRSLLYNMTLG